MRLSKYQKSRLLEFEWDVLQHDTQDDNTRWVQIDTTDPARTVDNLINILKISGEPSKFKILVVATRIDK